MLSTVTPLTTALLQLPSQKRYELYLFDFDFTLTQDDSEDIDEENSEELANNIKPGLADAFRAIWASDNALEILTRNPDNDLITKHLAAAGLTTDEIKKILIKNKNSMSSGSKPDWAIKALEDHAYAEVAYYYDDENEFLEAAKSKLLAAQTKGTCIGRKLITVEVPLEAKYSEHLTNIVCKLKDRTNSTTIPYCHFFSADTQQNTPDLSSSHELASDGAITPTLSLNSLSRKTNEK